MKALAAALVAAQTDMPAVEPDQVNPHFKTRFVSLDHLIAKTRPVLNRHGLAIVQLPATSDLGLPVLRTTLIHGPTGEQVSADTPLILSEAGYAGVRGRDHLRQEVCVGCRVGDRVATRTTTATSLIRPRLLPGAGLVPRPLRRPRPDDDIPFEPPPEAGLDDRRRKRMMALFRERGFVDREQTVGVHGVHAWPPDRIIQRAHRRGRRSADRHAGETAVRSSRRRHLMSGDRSGSRS